MIVNLTFLVPLTLRLELDPAGDVIVGSHVETPNVASMRELFDDHQIAIDDHKWNTLDDQLASELRDRLIGAIDNTDWPQPVLVS